MSWSLDVLIVGFRCFEILVFFDFRSVGCFWWFGVMFGFLHFAMSVFSGFHDFWIACFLDFMFFGFWLFSFLFDFWLPNPIHVFATPIQTLVLGSGELSAPSPSKTLDFWKTAFSIRIRPRIPTGLFPSRIKTPQSAPLDNCAAASLDLATLPASTRRRLLRIWELVMNWVCLWICSILAFKMMVLGRSPGGCLRRPQTP